MSLGSPQEAVAGGKAVLKQLDDVDLAAGGGQREEVQVVDVDIAVHVGLGVLGVEDIHLVELLGALRAVLEHGAHGGVAVDVGVLPLGVAVLGVLEGQILEGLHQAGVHLPHPGALRPVEDVLLGGAGVAVLDEGVLHRVLHLLDGGHRPLAEDALDIGLHLDGQVLGHLVVAAAEHLGRLEDGVGDLAAVEGHFPAVPLDDSGKHRASPLLSQLAGRQAVPPVSLHL